MTPRTATKNVTSRVSQTTLSDFSKNLEEPSPTESEEKIDDQTSSSEFHEIQCEKEYGIDPRADPGTLFFPDKIVMEQHSLTHTFSVNPGTRSRSQSKDELQTHTSA